MVIHGQKVKRMLSGKTIVEKGTVFQVNRPKKGHLPGINVERKRVDLADKCNNCAWVAENLKILETEKAQRRKTATVTVTGRKMRSIM